MAFNPSYNILDKDTHNTLVEALKSGGIGYTEADGTVHKISGDYVEGGGGGSSLPEVSADDNGDVLTVVSGEWAKATPSGGISYDAVIHGTSQDGVTFTYTLASGSFSAVYNKINTGADVTIRVVEASTIVAGDDTIKTIDSGEAMSYNIQVGEDSMIQFNTISGHALFWFSDGTITDTPPNSNEAEQS